MDVFNSDKGGRIFFTKIDPQQKLLPHSELIQIGPILTGYMLDIIVVPGLHKVWQ